MKGQVLCFNGCFSALEEAVCKKHVAGLVLYQVYVNFVSGLYILAISMEPFTTIIVKIADALKDKVTGDVADKVLNKVRRSDVERVYRRSLKKWTRDRRLRRLYAGSRIDTLEKLSEYLKDGTDMGGRVLGELCRLLYDEMKNDSSTCPLLNSLQLETLSDKVRDIAAKQDDIISIAGDIRDMECSVSEAVNVTGGIKEFSEVPGYMPRTCSWMYDDGCMADKFANPDRYRPFTLAEFVAGVTDSDSLRGVILAEAHAGKTTELYHLAYELQQDGMFNPVLYEVRTCSNLVDMLPKLAPDRQKETVLLIDALDERFDGNERNSLFRDIAGYACFYPHLRIILSCRSNFKGEMGLDGFRRIALDDVSLEQARTFMRDKGASGLIPYIEKDSLYEFIRIPFFLSALVDFYKSYGMIPSDKNALYEFVINKKLACEEDKRLGYRYDMQRDGRRLLEKLAVAMQLLGANSVTGNDAVSMLGCDDRGWNLVLHSGLLEQGDGKYRFVHNSFKEYFVAVVMCRMTTLESIKNICCYPGTDRIRDTWYNSVALYISRIKGHDAMFGEVLEWIVSSNKEMILFIDKRTMDAGRRSELFMMMTGDYNKKCLRIGHGSDYPFCRLMDFGFSVSSAEFLLAGLKEVKDINTPAVNLLWCAKFIDWDALYDNPQLVCSLRETLFDILGRSLDTGDRFMYVMLPFENRAFVNAADVARIRTVIGDSDSADVVSGFISAVNRAGLSDRYIDYILSKDSVVNNYSKDGVCHVVRRDGLYDAYKSVAERDSMIKVVSHVAALLREHDYQYTSDRDDLIGVLDAVLSGLASGYGSDSGVVISVYDAMLGCDKYFFDDRCADAVDLFAGYFRRTDVDDELFWKLYGQLEDVLTGKAEGIEYKQIRGLAFCAARMLSEERIECVSERLERNTAEGANILYWLRDYAGNCMQGLIDVKLRNAFPNHVREDYVRLAARREQADVDLLFDHDKFVKLVVSVAESKCLQNKDDVKELWKSGSLFSFDEEERLNRYVIWFFWHIFAGGKDFCMDDVERAAADMDLYHSFLFQHGVHYMYPDERESVVLSDVQKRCLVNIAEYLLERLASGAPVEGDAAAGAFKMLLNGDVAVSRDTALGLMPWAGYCIYEKGDGFYNTEHSILEYIENRGDVTVDEIAAAIYGEIDNDGWQHSLSRNLLFAKFFGRHGIRGGCLRTFAYIKGCNDEGGRWESLLCTMVEYPDSRVFVLDRIDELSALKRLYVWDCGMLFKDVSYRGMMQADMEENLLLYGDFGIAKALKLLLRLGSVAALEYLCTHLDTCPIRSDNFYFGSTCVDALSPLLEMYVALRAEDKLFDPFLSSVTDAISNIAVASDEGYNEVETYFRNLMDSGGDYIYLNSYLERWKLKRLEAGLDIWTVRRTGDFISRL